jgi:hypothetical protein
MDPITAALGAGNAAKNLLSGLVDRWSRVRNANLDAEALVRLLLLEARRNREILTVAVGAKEPLPPSVLWEVPLVLQTEVIEAVLGQGEVSANALTAVRRLKASGSENDLEGVDLLTNIYVRMVALQGLGTINKRNALAKVRIELRLKNLRSDLERLIKTLSS